MRDERSAQAAAKAHLRAQDGVVPVFPWVVPADVAQLDELSP